MFKATIPTPSSIVMKKRFRGLWLLLLVGIVSTIQVDANHYHHAATSDVDVNSHNFYGSSNNNNSSNINKDNTTDDDTPTWNGFNQDNTTDEDTPTWNGFNGDSNKDGKKALQAWALILALPLLNLFVFLSYSLSCCNAYPSQRLSYEASNHDSVNRATDDQEEEYSREIVRSIQKYSHFMTVKESDLANALPTKMDEDDRTEEYSGSTSGGSVECEEYHNDLEAGTHSGTEPDLETEQQQDNHFDVHQEEDSDEELHCALDDNLSSQCSEIMLHDDQDQRNETATSFPDTGATQKAPNQCSICLSSYEVNDTVIWSSNPDCTHAFHLECLLEWWKTQYCAASTNRRNSKTCLKCPYCRQVFIPLDRQGSHEEHRSRPSIDDAEDRA